MQKIKNYFYIHFIHLLLILLSIVMLTVFSLTVVIRTVLFPIYMYRSDESKVALANKLFEKVTGGFLDG